MLMKQPFTEFRSVATTTVLHIAYPASIASCTCKSMLPLRSQGTGVHTTCNRAAASTAAKRTDPPLLPLLLLLLLLLLWGRIVVLSACKRISTRPLLPLLKLELALLLRLLPLMLLLLAEEPGLPDVPLRRTKTGGKS